MSTKYELYPQFKSSHRISNLNDTVLSMRFPHKLWKIINECRSDAICWGNSGKTILIDYKKFQEEYLNGNRPFFKTRNVTSFIRQLNLYGFRKVNTQNRERIHASEYGSVHEFIHEGFRRGRLDLLDKVSRRPSGSKSLMTYEKLKLDGFTFRKVRKSTSILFKRKQEAKLLMTRSQIKDAQFQYAFEEALKMTVCQSYNEKTLEVEDPLAEIANSNSIDAVSELFGFEFSAIPNAEACMEWIEKNSNILSSDYSDSMELTFQNGDISECLEMKLRESTPSKENASLLVFNEAVITNRMDEEHIMINIKSDNEEEIEININDEEENSMHYSKEENYGYLGEAVHQQKKLQLPKLIYLNLPVRSAEVQENYYVHISEAYNF